MQQKDAPPIRIKHSDYSPEKPYVTPENPIFRENPIVDIFDSNGILDEHILKMYPSQKKHNLDQTINKIHEKVNPLQIMDTERTELLQMIKKLDQKVDRFQTRISIACCITASLFFTIFVKIFSYVPSFTC